MEIFPTGSKFGKEKEDYISIDDANVGTKICLLMVRGRNLRIVIRERVDYIALYRIEKKDMHRMSYL